MNTNEHELFVKKYKPEINFNRYESEACTVFVSIRGSLECERLQIKL
jgi:hypothetical protein